jgi:hypothetical protein
MRFLNAGEGPRLERERGRDGPARELELELELLRLGAGETRRRGWGAGSVAAGTVRGPTPGTLRCVTEAEYELDLSSTESGLVIAVEGTDDECEKREAASVDGDVLRVDGGEAATWPSAAASAENDSGSAVEGRASDV